MAGVAKQNRHLRGWLAEGLAFVLLVIKGYHVLAANHKGNYAEIDLLAQKGDRLCLVEVKFRRNLEMASLAIHPRQKDRQWREAMALARRYRHDGPVCFEAVLVFGHWPFVKHLKNVYGDIQ